MTATYDYSDALTGGEWVPDKHGIMRWEKRAPEPVGPGTFPDPIACPTCHARATEPCRTSTGRRIGEHKNRLIPKCCPDCGGELARWRHYCDTCADARRRETWRLSAARRRGVA